MPTCAFATAGDTKVGRAVSRLVRGAALSHAYAPTHEGDSAARFEKFLDSPVSKFPLVEREFRKVLAFLLASAHSALISNRRTAQRFA